MSKQNRHYPYTVKRNGDYFSIAFEYNIENCSWKDWIGSPYELCDSLQLINVEIKRNNRVYITNPHYTMGRKN